MRRSIVRNLVWCLFAVAFLPGLVWAQAETPEPLSLDQAAPDLTLSVEKLFGSFTYWRQTDEGYESGFIDFALDQTWMMVTHVDVDHDRYPDRVSVTRGQYSVGKRDDNTFGYWLEGENNPRAFLSDVIIVAGHVKSFVWQGRAFSRRTGDMPYFIMDQDVPALAGELVVNSTPPGAVVYLDGIRVPGCTPLTVKKPKAGVALRVRVELADCLPSEQVVTLAPNEHRELEFALSRGGSGLHIACNPRVRVKLDGAWIGYTPIDRSNVAPGAHVLEFVNDSLGIYRREKIEVSADQPFRRQYEFDGRLIVDVGRRCEIFRLGRSAGQTPFDQAVPVGRHVLTLVDDRGKKKRLVVDIPLDGTVRIDRPFDALPDAD